nr:hypothetical protein BaRGS_002660 [Batillaria attramentaria]
MIGVGRREVKGLPLVGPVTVTVTYDLVAVMDLNAEQGYMETTGWLYMSWTDPRLAYTSTRGAGDLTNIAVDKDSIWTPDIELYNIASSGLKMLGQKTQAVVSQDGTVFLIEKTNVRSVCDVSGQLAHGDSVMCPLKFGSWIHNMNKLDVQLKGDSDEADRDGPKPLPYEVFSAYGASAFCACQYTTGRRMSEAEIRELLQIGSQGIKGLPLETVDVQLMFDLTGVTELGKVHARGFATGGKLPVKLGPFAH